MEAVVRQLIRSDVIPDVAGLGTLGQHVSEHVAEPLAALMPIVVITVLVVVVVLHLTGVVGPGSHR